eukprot:gene7508-10230_t
MMNSTIAEVVPNQNMKIQIPPGLREGDSFIVTPDDGRVFTVVVPEGVIGGSYIEVIIPDERAVHEKSDGITISKAAIGAAVVGGVIGAVLVGPITGLVLAGGAAYVSTKANGKVGTTTRQVGEKAFNGISSAKKWVEKSVTKL